MKTFKNKVMSLSLAVGMMAIGLSLNGTNAQQLEPSEPGLTPGGDDKPKCYHQTGNGSGLVNFCSGTECVATSGNGTNFATCG